MHPKITNPLVREIRRNLGRIYGSLDRPNSSSSDSIDFLAISWMARFLGHFDYDVTRNFLGRCKPIIDELLLGKPPSLKHIRITDLQGLFNHGRNILEAATYDSHAVRAGFDRLLSVLAGSNWLSSPSLAAYAIYGLKGIASDAYIEGAEEYIRTYFGTSLNEEVFRYPEILLGLPSLLDHEEIKSHLKSKRFLPESSSSRAILVFALTNGVRDSAELREPLYSLLERCAEDVEPDAQAYNPISQSLLGFSFVNLGLVQVHLVNTTDYEKVNRFFETQTVLVAKRVEYIQELIVLCCIAILVLVEVVYASPIVVSYLQITGPLSVEIAGFALAALNGFLFYRLLAPFLLPELSGLVHRTLTNLWRRDKLEQ